eukprot:1229244-Rhodomonas_salina.1
MLCPVLTCLGAMPSPVLSSCMVLRRIWYSARAVSLCARYAMSGPELVYADAVCCTELTYGAMLCP